MPSIVILNIEKLNSQVLVSCNKLSDNSWSFTLNNITKNAYKIFLESYFSEDSSELIFKEASPEFYLHPGIITVTESETGEIISKIKNKIELNSVNPINSKNGNGLSSLLKYQISICVRQKYGPDLGYQKIEL